MHKSVGKERKKFLIDTYDISVHFSTRHDNHYSAYKYVAEEDQDALHSPGHPNLASGKSPQTKESTKALRHAAKQRRSLESEAKPGPSSVSKKKRRLSNLDVSELLLKNGIKRDIELLALANTQKAEGKCDLAEFVLGKSDKSLKELITCTWKMENASKTLQRENKSQMSLIRQSESEAQCVDGCNGKWQECALQVLKQNNVHPYVFASAGRERSFGKGARKVQKFDDCRPCKLRKNFFVQSVDSYFGNICQPSDELCLAWS